MGYFKDTLKGILWIGTLRSSSRAVGYIKIAILARLLGPEQFGIFGIASILLAFLEIMTETGISAFMIQQEDDIKRYLDTSWTLSILRGLFISILLFLLAKPISLFFKSPDSYLLICLISIIPLIKGFINPSIVKFQKDLFFNKEFYFRLFLLFVDATVAIYLAIVLRNAFAFVMGMAASSVFELIISLLLIKPKPSFIFNLNKVKFILKRSKWITLSGILNYFIQEGDDVVVGKLISIYSLGLYQVAYKISTLPLTEAGEVIYKVTFPVFVKIRGDLKRLRTAFIKTFIVLTIILLPFGIILFFFTKPVIYLFLGSKWLSIIPVIKILIIYGIGRAITGLYSPLFLSLKKQKYNSYILLVSLFGMLVSIFPLVKIYGIVGAGISVLLGWCMSLPLTTILIYKVLRDNKTN
ncbi:MAG: Membrane protein involved in the export of O-antigen and teichoic acid [Microgenomates group bacterium GW2011_GWC1_37_8]|uniref:Membrane protein involved in the export of O-antigen and teichoic acid n=1 Tax=Candidatus Woesebacteria bacterium GW2011_GWB1_38_8 TaxID=1618570 RepID=A0A0G0P8X9_9BACT|nr:MAG: Membrane protein involved in the export of O-antigen and teichoic acid [Microgenomates group bacterium GW2011_GWC1_37_8]KKQ85766.1 MAG: Membrane protein involved in the export of O-antigen and teichoic acid [Candidatus Woesebacteria bacterium GW2011_GWB1_38_8]